MSKHPGGTGRALRLVAATLLGCLAAGGASADDAVHLVDVVTASMGGGVTLEQAQDDVQKAQADLREAQGAFDWKADAKAGAQRLYFPKTANGYLTDTLDDSVSMHETAGIGRLLRNGVEGQVGFSMYSNTNSSAAQTGGATKPRPEIQLQVPFMRGFGHDSPAAARERAAQDTVAGATLQRGFAGQQAVHDAVQTYWRCYAAQLDTDVARSDQAASDDYLASVTDQVKAGLMEPTLLSRVQARQGLEHAELSRLEQAAALCRRDLAVLMGSAYDSEEAPLADDFPAPDGLQEDADALTESGLLELALRQRTDVQALEQYLTAEGERLRGAKNTDRTDIGLLADSDSVYLHFSKALGSNAEAGGVQRAIASEDEARLKLHQLQSQIRRDVFDGLRSLRSALNGWRGMELSSRLLEQSARDARERAHAGTSSWQEYREVQHDLATVRHELIAQKLQLASSIASLRLATGTIYVDGKHTPDALANLFRTLPRRSEGGGDAGGEMAPPVSGH